MQRQQVSSQTIASAGYDPEKREMDIEFANGRVYTCRNVPQEVFDGLMSADSPGRYFNAAIKGQYL